MSEIRNVAAVKERIAAAASRAGRKPEDIAVLYATKYAKAEIVAELLAHENRLLIGENRVQDAREKFARLKGLVSESDWARIETHMIGTLQSNKVGKALETFDAIQSVDSLELAVKIGRKAGESGRIIPVYIEVNAGEVSKRGIAFEELDWFVAEARELENIKVEGLMTMAPHAGPEITRPIFRKVKEACARHGLKASMGMTNDFEIAVEEGSDMVRVGRAVFEA